MFRVAGERLTMRLRCLAFGAMLRQEIGWYDEPANGTGALCSKLSTEAAAVQGAIGQRIGTIIQSCSTIGLSVGLAMYYEWRIGFLGMAFIPLIMSVTYIQGLLFRKETLNYHTSLESSTKVFNFIYTRIILKLFSESKFLKDCCRSCGQHSNRDWSLSRRYFLQLLHYYHGTGFKVRNTKYTLSRISFWPG